MIFLREMDTTLIKLVIISMTYIALSKSQHTQTNVCNGGLQNLECRFQNLEIQQRYQDDLNRDLANTVNKLLLASLLIKDCSDLFHDGKKTSGVYSIYSRHNR